MKLFVGTAACALSLVALGCSTVTVDDGSNGSVTVTTDKPSYESKLLGGSGVNAMYGFTLVARIENHSSKSVLLNTCGDHVFYNVELADGAFNSLSAYDPVWACRSIASTLELKPGDIHEETLLLQGPSLGGGHELPTNKLSGPMVIGYGVTPACIVGCAGIIVRSNVFEVKLVQ